MNEAKSLLKKWKLFAPTGLAIIGFGACLIAEAAMLKYDGVEWWKWTTYGTFALIVFNSGLCIFGQSIIYKAKYESIYNKENAS